MKNLPIRTKLLLAFLFFSLLPLLFLSTASFVATARYYEDQVWYSADQAFDQTYQFLASKVQTVVKASDILYYSAEVQRALGRDQARYGDDFVTQNIDMAALDQYLASFRSTEDVYRAILWVPGWLNYAEERISYQSLDRLRGDPAAARLFESKEKVTFFPPETIVDDVDQRRSTPVVSLYRRIRDVNNIPRFIGVIQISVLESTLSSVLAKARTTRGSLVFLQYSTGEQILPEGTDPVRATALGQAVADRRDPGVEGWNRLLTGGTFYSYRTRDFPGIDWTLVEVIPQADIVHQTDQFRSWLLAAVLLIAAAALVAAWFLSRSATRRLTALTAAMDRMGHPDLLDRLDTRSLDEIGLLTASFRAMVLQIDQLLAEQYKAGQDLKSAELKALQAQINPHFLYNTLEMINWQALNRGVPEIAEVSRALARFYALSLNNGRDVVTLEQELAHVTTYAAIQNRRFENRIAFQVKVPQTLLSLELPKILLQPLVENAILHGILEKGENQGGSVTVSGRRQGEVVFLSVQDDGVGMTEERVSRLLSDEPSGDPGGYGVKNIDERVKLFFGDGAGLSFRSSVGKGTTATLRIHAPRRESGQVRKVVR